MSEDKRRFFDHVKLNRLADLKEIECCLLIGCENQRIGGLCKKCADEIGAEESEKLINELEALLKNYQLKRSKISDEQILEIINESKNLINK